jgi:hypothetical protein
VKSSLASRSSSVLILLIQQQSRAIAQSHGSLTIPSTSGRNVYNAAWTLALDTDSGRTACRDSGQSQVSCRPRVPHPGLQRVARIPPWSSLPSCRILHHLPPRPRRLPWISTTFSHRHVSSQTTVHQRSWQSDQSNMRNCAWRNLSRSLRRAGTSCLRLRHWLDG